MIYPCICNQSAHRNCMKKYIIANCEYSCGECKSNYAIGYSYKNNLQNLFIFFFDNIDIPS